MDFSFTEEQEMLRTSARDFLSKECPKTKVRELEESGKGYDPEMWKKMAELGWMGLVLPEEYGGIGGEFMDLAILLEEMGRNIVPGPFFSTVGLCSLPILRFGSQGQKKGLLTEIATGELIMALALIELPATYKASGIKVEANKGNGDYVISGTKLFVTDANVADYFLIVTRTAEGKKPVEGITLFLVDAKNQGIKVEVIPTTGMDKQCEVVFDGVRVPKENILGETNQGWEIVEWTLERAAILKCAEMLGGCQAVLEMANSYAKERVQFDRPIGSFQIIQHKLADMVVEIEGIRYLTYEAAWKMSEGLPCSLEISMAKARVSEVYQRVCIEGHQIHGAIGFTRDHDMGLYFRRAKVAEITFGNADFHREKVAQEVGL